MKALRVNFILLCALGAILPSATLFSATTNVTTSGFTFVPAVITINAGDTVIWTGLGGVHSVTGDDPTEPLCGSNFPPSCTNTFNAPGSYAYHCIPHQSFGMTGLVHVLAPPTVPAMLSEPQALPGGDFQFTISSTANRTNVVEATTNAANQAAWDTVATLVPTNTPFLFIDSNASSFPLRFYRVVQPE